MSTMSEKSPAGMGKRGRYGTQASEAAKKKKMQREKSEQIRVTLDELVTRLNPGRPDHSDGVRSRSTINVVKLLEDTIELVKQARIMAGLAIPERKVFDPSKFKGRGKGLNPKARKNAEDRLKALSEAVPPAHTPVSGQAALVASSREALLGSESLGVMLVRVQDMMVVENSRALERICGGTKDGLVRGFKNQSLLVMVHFCDSAAVKRIQTEALEGSLKKGTMVSCRILRLNHESQSGCLLAGWAWVDLQVSYASRDGNFVLLTFNLTPKLNRPLSTEAAFWKRYYAQGKAVSDVVSGLYRRHKAGEKFRDALQTDTFPTHPAREPWGWEASQPHLLGTWYCFAQPTGVPVCPLAPARDRHQVAAGSPPKPHPQRA